MKFDTGDCIVCTKETGSGRFRPGSVYKIKEVEDNILYTLIDSIGDPGIGLGSECFRLATPTETEIYKWCQKPYPLNRFEDLVRQKVVTNLKLEFAARERERTQNNDYRTQPQPKYLVVRFFADGKVVETRKYNHTPRGILEKVVKKEMYRIGADHYEITYER